MPQNDNDTLSQLFSSGDTVSRLFELASAMSAQNQTDFTSAETSPPAADQTPPQAPASSSPDMAQILAALLAQRSQDRGTESAPPPQQNPQQTAGGGGSNSFATLMEQLPQLLQAMNGDGSTLPSERVNLVQAIKPYAGERGNSIDRAVRMAGVAKAAKSALNLLGRRSE